MMMGRGGEGGEREGDCTVPQFRRRFGGGQTKHETGGADTPDIYYSYALLLIVLLASS